MDQIGMLSLLALALLLSSLAPYLVLRSQFGAQVRLLVVIGIVIWSAIIGSVPEVLAGQIGLPNGPASWLGLWITLFAQTWYFRRRLIKESAVPIPTALLAAVAQGIALIPAIWIAIVILSPLLAAGWRP